MGKSGIVQHKQVCKEPVDWENYEVIAQVRNSGRFRYRVEQELQIRESLEIKFRQTGPSQGLNLDHGNLMSKDSWEHEIIHGNMRQSF